MDVLSVLHRKSRALLSLVAMMALIGAPASTVSAQPLSEWGRVHTLSTQTTSDGRRVDALSAQANSDWDRVDALPDGARVRITRASGERHQYLFRRATANALVVTRATGTGADEILSKSEVTKVVRHGVRDSSADGTALGALAGFGVGVGLMAIVYVNACDTCDPPTFWAPRRSGRRHRRRRRRAGGIPDRSKARGNPMLYLAASVR